MRFEDGYGAPEKRYSPECVEGAFPEIRLQDPAWFGSGSTSKACCGPTKHRMQPNMWWCRIKMRKGAYRPGP
jgi:hypothetical protein